MLLFQVMRGQGENKERNKVGRIEGERDREREGVGERGREEEIEREGGRKR